MTAGFARDCGGPHHRVACSRGEPYSQAVRTHTAYRDVKTITCIVCTSIKKKKNCPTGLTLMLVLQLEALNSHTLDKLEYSVAMVSCKGGGRLCIPIQDDSICTGNLQQNQIGKLRSI